MSHLELINRLVEEGYLKTPRIIKAFEKIDRVNFVPESLAREAYVNAPLPIGFGQTISQPLTVAFMIELLQPEPGDTILDIGSGSGWQSAILAQIVGEKGKVFAVETIPQLLELGKKNAEKYRFVSEGRLRFILGDGALGFSQGAPFDKIIAAAAAELLPQAWKDQLKIGGRLVAPVKSSVWFLEKKDEDKFEKAEYPGFAFVPLVSRQENGAYSWKKHFWNPKKNA